jgi:PhnB protein
MAPFTHRQARRDTMRIQPYLFFDGRCEEALAFYKQALDAEIVTMMRFKDAPVPVDSACDGPPGPPPAADKVMHAAFRVGKAEILASDGMAQGKPEFKGISLALLTPDIATADRYFAALADGGQVQMPQDKTFFSPRFGMVADRFGISWMIMPEQ